MKIYMSEAYLDFYEVLASRSRLQIIQLLAESDMSVKELAEKIGISSSIITKHVRKLESANIITSSLVNKNGSSHRICKLLNTTYELQGNFTINRGRKYKNFHQISIPVGHFTDLNAQPPCGLAGTEAIIGELDEPKVMWTPERANAQLVWISDGYIEYKIPNYMRESQKLVEIEISGEFGSEAAGYNDDWPSSIRVFLNEMKICKFTTPGDFGEKRGEITPEWWTNNQYGILVVIRINKSGVFVNGEKKSDITTSDFDKNCEFWKLSFNPEPLKENGGGLTIFGEKFGYHPQDIIFKLYYE